jgi:hypothetical protein
MRSAKPSDSPTGYDREIQPRKRVLTLAEHEAEVRRVLNDRHERRFQALLPSAVTVESGDFEGCVE